MGNAMYRMVNVYEPVTDGLIQSLRFNGDLTDNSGNGWNGTYAPSGTPSYPTGQVSNAISLDGSHYVNAGSVQGLMNYFTGNVLWTVSCWIKTTVGGYAWAVWDGVANHISLFINESTARASRSQGGGGQYIDIIHNFCDNAWHLIVCKYDGAKLYIDIDNGTYTANVASTWTIAINEFSMYTLGYVYFISASYYTGLIDQYRVFNRVLSAAEITSLYTETADGLLVPKRIRNLRHYTGSAWVRDRAMRYFESGVIEALVLSGETIFDSTTAAQISISKLDNTHAIIAWLDNSYGTAIIATINGDEITYGSKYVFNAASTTNTCVAALDTTHAIIAYSESSPYPGKAVIATVDGDEITFGSEYQFDTTSSLNNVKKLDSTHAIIVYTDKGNSDYGTAIIATVNGTEITFGSEYVFASGTTNTFKRHALGILDSTHAIIAYGYPSGGSTRYDGTAIIATINGTEITFGSPYIFFNYILNVPTTYIALDILDSTHAIIVYYNTSDKGATKIATISGTEISYGSACIHGPEVAVYQSVCTLDTTHAVIMYYDSSGTDRAEIKIANINGNAVTFGTEYILNNNGTNEMDSAFIDESKIVAAYHTAYVGSNGGRTKVVTMVEQGAWKRVNL